MWVFFPASGRSPGGGNGNPLQYSHLENSVDRGAWQTTAWLWDPMDCSLLGSSVHGVTQSQTWLKQLSTAQHILSLNQKEVKTPYLRVLNWGILIRLKENHMNHRLQYGLWYYNKVTLDLSYLSYQNKVTSGLCMYYLTNLTLGFPGSLAGKESSCNAGDHSSVPGSGRSPGEGIVYPLQYSWVSLLAQTVKKPPAIQETWVQSLGWKDPLEKGMAIPSSILGWRSPSAEEPSRLQSMGSQSQTQLSDFHIHNLTISRCNGLSGDDKYFSYFQCILPNNPYGGAKHCSIY